MTWYFSTGRRNKADLYLAIIFLLLFISFLFAYFQISGIMEAYPWLMFLDMGIPFLLGPVIWFYIISITGTESSVRGNKFLHLVPSIMIYLLFADIIFLDASEKSRILKYTVSDMGIRFQIENILQLIPVPAYIIAGLFMIKEYEKKLKTAYSSIEGIRHRWLKSFLVIFLIYWIIISAGLSMNNILGRTEGYAVFLSGWILFSLITGFYGIRHNRIIRSVRLFQDDSQADEASKPADDFQPGEFEHYIDQKKPFLDPELHINDLAVQLGMQPYRLSRILNSYYGTSFYDYIGGLRIEEFKKRVKSGEHHRYPILQVAYDCGFNSKSSFYRAFKNKTGIKPGEYIKDLNNSDQL